MNATRGCLALALAVAVLCGCGEDQDAETCTDDTAAETAVGPKLGEPCSSAIECQGATAGARCGALTVESLPVCFMPCDPSEAVPACDDCTLLPGEQCGSGFCSGFCPLPPRIC